MGDFDELIAPGSSPRVWGVAGWKLWLTAAGIKRFIPTCVGNRVLEDEGRVQ